MSPSSDPSGFSPVILSTGRLRLTLLPYGLTVHALEVSPAPDSGSTTVRDLLVGPAFAAEHHHAHPSGRKFLNQTVGRYANRLPAGRSVLPGGAVLHLAGDGGVCLHGGEAGLDTVVWAVKPAGEGALFGKDEVGASGALFGYESAAGADGFPLRLAVEGLVSLVPGEGDVLGTVKVQLRAKVVEEGDPEEEKGTPVNLTVHWGFNLADFASGAEGETGAKAHRLFVDSDHTPALDHKMLPTGQPSATAGTALDFTQGTPADPASHRTLGADFPAGGVDHNLVFSSPAEKGDRVVLTSPDGRTSLAFRTNQSSVQAYTGGGMDGSGSRKEAHAVEGGRGYDQFDGVFLEFHHPLGACLHPELAAKAGTDTILKAGEVYDNWVEMDVVVRD